MAAKLADSSSNPLPNRFIATELAESDVSPKSTRKNPYRNIHAANRPIRDLPNLVSADRAADPLGGLTDAMRTNVRPRNTIGMNETIIMIVVHPILPRNALPRVNHRYSSILQRKISHLVFSTDLREEFTSTIGLEAIDDILSYILFEGGSFLLLD